MKLQAIKKACLEGCEFTVMNARNGQQWISNGAAMWPIDGITIEKESLPALFDLTVKQTESLMLREIMITNNMMTLEPVDGEEILEDFGKVWENGQFFRALASADGVLYINCAWERPVENGHEMTYAKRTNGDQTVIAAYDGLLACAIILPFRGDVMAPRLKQIASMQTYHIPFASEL